MNVLKTINSKDYWKVKDYFKSIDFNLVVDSILNNNTIGQVNVDDPDDPSFSYIWTYTDSILIGGKPCEEAKMLPEILNKKLIPEFKKYGLPGMLIYVDMNSSWKELIPEIFGKDRISVLKRRFYTMDLKTTLVEEKESDEFKIISIESAMKNRSLKNHRLLDGWVHSFWKDLTDFRSKGTGYCALVGDTITSWCLTVYAFDDRRELGLETVDGFRNKGLATAVTRETIRECKRLGYKLHWHCREDNTPSIAIAEKLGFIRNKDYELFYLVFE
ncbi:MAG: GNAT family N-acetyltransferase [Kosmotoga sp.]|nr:MAG: GNAT family N-acetyltransferase [Kosmotoga sp.]